MVARPPSSAGRRRRRAWCARKLAKPAPVKKPAPAKAKAPVAKAKPAPVPPVEAGARRAVAPAVDAKGLPRVLSTALAGNRVVVVGLHDPDSALDQMALAEARAGARAAGAGFVAINVFAEAQSRPLLSSSAPWRTPGCSSTAARRTVRPDGRLRRQRDGRPGGRERASMMSGAQRLKTARKDGRQVVTLRREQSDGQVVVALRGLPGQQPAGGADPPGPVRLPRRGRGDDLRRRDLARARIPRLHRLLAPALHESRAHPPEPLASISMAVAGERAKPVPRRGVRISPWERRYG